MNPTPFNRTPPQSLEAEQAVLGCMLLHQPARARALEMLKGEDFYHSTHQVIFDTILMLSERDTPVDLVTVENALKETTSFENIGGRLYLQNLMEAPASIANIESYARVVEEKSILRRVSDSGLEISGLAYSEYESIDDVLDQSERIIFNVGQRRMDKFFHHLRPLLDTELDRIEKRYENKGVPTGRQTPFDDLNWMTAGFQPSDLIIVAARPGSESGATIRRTMASRPAPSVRAHSSSSIGICSMNEVISQMAKGRFAAA